jgi:hypothetical protein
MSGLEKHPPYKIHHITFYYETSRTESRKITKCPTKDESLTKMFKFLAYVHKNMIGIFCIQYILFARISEPPPPPPAVILQCSYLSRFSQANKTIYNPPHTAFFCSMKIFFPTRFAIESAFRLSLRLNMD